MGASFFDLLSVTAMKAASFSARLRFNQGYLDFEYSA